MASGRKIVQKTSFLGGEAGHLLNGRSDLAQFQYGAEEIKNFVALKNGPITRRPGTRFVKTTQGNKPARIIDFVVSYDSGEKIFVVEIARASGTSLTFRVIRVSDGSVFTPTGNSPLTVAAITINNLNEIQYAQIGNSVIIVHPAFPPQVLTQPDLSVAAFTVSNYVDTSGIQLTLSRAAHFSAPYRNANISANTLSIDVATVGTGRVVTAGSAFFNAGHVGAWFRMKVASDPDGYFVVTGFTNSTTVTVEVTSTITTAATTTTNWSESAWSTYRGFPRTITFYNQRTVFGGNTSQPDTFWMSQVSDYFQMSAASSGIDDPLNFTLASNKLNEIKWMVGGKKLTIGTGSSEWVGTVSNDGTNLFVNFDEETNHGSAYIQAKKVAYTIPFVQRSKRLVRELNFNFDSDSYIATDLNIFSNHVGGLNRDFPNESGGPELVAAAYQESPYGIYWTIDSFGKLYGLTRDVQQQIAAWHSHTIGGQHGDTDEWPAGVKSICVVPSETGAVDRLWMVVYRQINNVATYMIEYMDDIKPQPYVSPEPAYFINATDESGIYAHLDCASLSSAALGMPQTTWTGFTHLASQEVYVIVKGTLNQVIYSGLTTVNGSGEITTASAQYLIVGFHSNAILRLLPPEGGNNPEVTLFSNKSTDTAVLRLHETFGLKMGKNKIQKKAGLEYQNDFEPIPFDVTNLPEPASFTGTKEIQVRSETDKEGSFALAMEDPWPCTILSISSRVVGNEV